MAGPSPLTLTVYSDVLCPWCYNAAVRMGKIKAEYGDRVEIAWRTFLLRPYPQAKPMEKFRRYTESWKVPGAQPDSGRFRVWSTDEAPPSHSIPPNVALKAAERQGAHDSYQLAVMDAYFYRNRNVTDAKTLIDLAASVDLDVDRFRRDFVDPQVERAVVADHREAFAHGVTAVPTVIAGPEWQIPGAQDMRFYRHVVDKALAMATNE